MPRQPLVRIETNSNARKGSESRKALPTRAWQSAATAARKTDMDVGDPRKTSALSVTPAIKSYYLDSEDNRGK